MSGDETFVLGMHDLTTRAYFAALALQGLLANPSWNRGAAAALGMSDAEAVFALGATATQYADALILALSRPGEAKEDHS